MPETDFTAPIIDACQSHFITATTAARSMIEQDSGVIIMLSATAAMETRHEMGGFSLACASIEALTRALAGEVGRKGVRVVGMRSNFTPEANGATDADVPFLVKDTLLGRLSGSNPRPGPEDLEIAGAVQQASGVTTPGEVHPQRQQNEE